MQLFAFLSFALYPLEYLKQQTVNILYYLFGYCFGLLNTLLMYPSD